MKKNTVLMLLAILSSTLMITSCSPTTSTMKGETSALDPVMGDYQGYVVSNEGAVSPLAVQVIVLGGKNYGFTIQQYFDQKGDLSFPISVEAQLENGKFIPTTAGSSSLNLASFQVTYSDGVVSGRSRMKEAQLFELKHVVRLPPTLGAKPPTGAVILFDGTTLDGWERRDVKQKGTPVGWKVQDRIAEVTPGTGDIVSKQKFSDFQLHLEFRLPVMPEATGQGRANSGVYLQGRYEVQVLDSYGLKGEDNECGGIYKVARPRVNMCAPPGQWQTYDITFRAPRFDQAGKKTKDAELTVLHNGVLIHENLAVPGPTGGALDEDVTLAGGLLLQDHGNLVQYRNIWLMELKQ
ncbi:MAG: hypothetical protein HW407_71 [Bacteroidetes bacterium]|jgi:hypothetical protein|nr:hypothetical protein [Bacteroidota bacterium]